MGREWKLFVIFKIRYLKVNVFTYYEHIISVVHFLFFVKQKGGFYLSLATSLFFHLHGLLWSGPVPL